MTKRLTIALMALVALVLVVVLPVAASVDYMESRGGNWSIVYGSQQVFIGEQNIDINNATLTTSGSQSVTIEWFSANTPVGGNASKSVVVNPSSFFVDPAVFGGFTGTWYNGNGPFGFSGTTPAISVQDPSFAIQIRDITQDPVVGKVVNGASVPQGNNVTFAIISNIYTVANQRNITSGITPISTPPQNGVLGFVNIKIKSDQGATFSALKNATGGAIFTYDQNVNNSLWFWAGAGQSNAGPSNTNNWATGFQSVSGVFDYPAGVYTVSAEIRLNHMKDNYKDSSGADYSGKTVTAAQTVTLVSDTVQIQANKDTVVRGNPFSVTVTGKPNTYYFLFLKSVSSLTGDPLILGSGNYSTAAPTVDAGQSGVYISPNSSGSAPDPVGNYTYMNGLLISGDQPNINNANRYRAIIKLDDTGKRTVQFSTSRLTKDQKFTVRVEYDNNRPFVFGGAAGTTPLVSTGAPYFNATTNAYSYIYSTTISSNRKSDEVDVTVQKGSVTIVAAGDQNYYLGEEIKLSGTNTESKTTYLFITGPNVGGTNGANLNSPTTQVQQGSTTGWQTADVLSDNTWSFKWQTQNIQLDAGTYTIYAVSDTQAKPSLSNATYGTVSVVIKKPFVSATASQSTVAKGDKFYITGTAEGNPSQGVQIWMLGKNFVGPATATTTGNGNIAAGTIVGTTATQTVNADATFSYEVKQSSTKDLATGQYFVVVQHPMYNNQLDILYDLNNGSVYSRIATPALAPIFYLGTTGGTTGSLQGSDAAEALIDAINTANVDDTYTKLSVLIEQPVINVDPITDHYVGDKFTITGTTNLAVGDNILVEVTSSSFKPTQKTQSGEFSGASGTVQATKGTNGANTWSFDVDASTFKPDEYLVKATAVEQDATGTALFNILEGTPVTATPTPAKTVVATTVATPVSTPVPTTATPTPTPTQPGFGALVALIGLGAVAFLVVRRN